MIKTVTDEKGVTTFVDDSASLPQPMLDAVQAAMAAGLLEFTTPTPEDDQKRVDWHVRNWVTSRNGKPAAFLVAYKDSFAQFEVIGPGITLNAEPGLSRRTMEFAPPGSATIGELTGANPRLSPPSPPRNVPYRAVVLGRTRYK
jgi:hypothetical protein